MYENDARGFNCSDRQAESTDNHPTCYCGEPILGIVARGPSQHHAVPCGCRITTTTARDLAGADRGRGVATDGGEDCYGAVTRMAANNADTEELLLGHHEDGQILSVPEIHDGTPIRARRYYEPSAVVLLPETMATEDALDWLDDNRDHPHLDGYDWDAHDKRDLIDAVVSTRNTYRSVLSSFERKLANIHVIGVEAREEVEELREEMVEATMEGPGVEVNCIEKPDEEDDVDRGDGVETDGGVRSESGPRNRVKKPHNHLDIDDLGHCESAGRHHIFADFYRTDRHENHDGKTWVCCNCNEAAGDLDPVTEEDPEIRTDGGAYEVSARDTDEMTIAELREEFSELQDEVDFWEPYEGQEAALDRRDEVWKALRKRTDVEPPECPECDGQRWGQSPGDPVECLECGWTATREVEEAVHEAWDQIAEGEEVDA